MRRLKRREFLKNLELVGIGCVAGGVLAPVVTSCGGGGGGGVTTSSQANAEQTTQQLRLPKPPFPYKELDPKKVADLAYKSAYSHAKVGSTKAKLFEVYGCAYGTFNALITVLAQKIGFPYNMIPTVMLNFGRAGVINWSTLCGALNGVFPVVNLVSPIPEAVINSLCYWYSTTELPIYVPSEEVVNEVYNNLKEKKGEEEAEKYKRAVNWNNTYMKKSVSGSPICHISVAKWEEANSKTVEFNGTDVQVPLKGVDSKEREDRCARLVADVVAKTVEFLNQQIIYKNFSPLPKATPEVQNCLGCHGKGEGTNPESPTPVLRDDSRMQAGVTCTNCHSTIDPDTHPFNSAE